MMNETEFWLWRGLDHVIPVGLSADTGQFIILSKQLLAYYIAAVGQFDVRCYDVFLATSSGMT